MAKRMNITGYLIVSLEGQLSPDKAIGELVENSIDAGARAINLVLTRQSMTICDNGSGSDDPNDIATPSASRSRHKSKAIGSKAIGAKQAMATFGRHWNIWTVPEGSGLCHHYDVHWDENGPLPMEYAGPALSRRDAPSDIRNGGTKITVTGRRDGFPFIRLEKLCSSLEKRYRPALSGGIKIAVRNPEIGHDQQLNNPAFDQQLFSAKILDTQGVAAGRKFNIRYGLLKEDHRVLSGMHFIFGPRVIKTEQRVGKYVLPSSCYIDVILSEQWKTTLSTNKDDINRYRDELVAEVEGILGPWIEEQRRIATEYKMEMLSGFVSDMLNESISMLDKKRAGESGPKPVAIPQDTEEIRIRVRRKPQWNRRPRIGGKGTFSPAKEIIKKCAKLKIEPDPKLGRRLFRTSFSPSGDEVTICLNTGEHNREIAEYYRQEREDELYKVGAMAFADLVSANPKMFSPVFSGLREHGYQIDETDNSSDIRSMVANFMLDAVFDRQGSIKKQRKMAA